MSTTTERFVMTDDDAAHLAQTASACASGPVDREFRRFYWPQQNFFRPQFIVNLSAILLVLKRKISMT
jgi:hypothetical protein